MTCITQLDNSLYGFYAQRFQLIENRKKDIIHELHELKEFLLL